jgi:hypothetical protein
MGVEISLERMTSRFGISCIGNAVTLPEDTDGSGVIGASCGAFSVFSASTFRHSIKITADNPVIASFAGNDCVDPSVFFDVAIMSGQPV